MAALPTIDVGDRERRLFEALDGHDLAALLVTSPTNIRWLTGFSGSNATVIVSDGQLRLITDTRYRDRAPAELASVASSASVVVPTSVADELRSFELEQLAVEADHVSWAQQRTMADDWLPDVALEPTVGLIDALRAEKDPAEVARIERAASHVDAALGRVVTMLGDEPSEREFARVLEAAIRADGAEDLGFDTIVASGPNGAIPHHHAGDRVISTGDFVIVDVGARVDGYRSDMTRTFSVGPMSVERARHYDTVIEAQQSGVEAMVAGARTATVHAAARSVIEAAGWGDAFTHGTGHGVGLDIHELPRVRGDVDDVYAVGTVATVEPGVYLRGDAGVRIEDTCVVTASGAERLTKFPKDPEI